METGAFLMLLAMVLGLVLGLLAVVVLIVLAARWIDGRVQRIGDLERELAARGYAPTLVTRIADDVRLVGASVAFPALIFAIGLAALAWGVVTVGGMYAPEPEELALYPAPGVALLVVAVIALVRGRARPRDAAPLYRALVTNAAMPTLLVPTYVRMRVEVTGIADAAVRTRAYRWQDIPHVVVVRADGTELALRAEDQVERVQLEQALLRVMPAARVAPGVTQWSEGMGRRLLAA